MRLASARAHHAADVRRDDDNVVLWPVALLDVARHHGGGEQVVGRDVEESLDLAGVQVERQHAVDAGAFDQVGDELGRDRRTRPRLAVLAGVAEVRDHGRDAPRGRPLQGIHQDQQLHEVVVGGERRRLDDEHVLAAHVLLDLDENLHVGEAPHLALGEGELEVGADRLGQRTVAVAADELHGRTIAAVPVTGVEWHGARLHDSALTGF